MDAKSFWKLQNYLKQNKEFFSNDTIIDNPNIIVDGLPFPEILIRLGRGDFKRITFIDNPEICNSKIDSLMLFTNNLIPNKY